MQRNEQPAGAQAIASGSGTANTGSAQGRVKAWVLASRPKTLSLALVPVVVGTALALAEGVEVDWLAALVALLAAILIQVGTNLHNDVGDYERGSDDPVTRLGPLRVTAAGLLSAKQVRRGAWSSFAAAFVLGLYLVWVGGWPILLAGLASIAAGAAYTGGPRPLAYSGAGEGFVLVFFGLVAVAGSYYLQAHSLTPMVLVAGLVVGMPAAAVLVVNNYRDLDNDARNGKNTLAVRYGRRFSRVEYGLLMLLPFLLWPVGVGWSKWGAAGLSVVSAAILPWLVLPWALWLVWRFSTLVPGPVFNSLLANTARFQLGLGLLLCLSLWAG